MGGAAAPPTGKVCRKCGSLTDDFYKHRITHRNYICRRCDRQDTTNRRLKDPEKAKEITKRSYKKCWEAFLLRNSRRHCTHPRGKEKILSGQSKFCTKCKVEKDLIFFNKEASRPLGIRSECKECRNHFVIRNNRRHWEKRLVTTSREHSLKVKGKPRRYVREHTITITDIRAQFEKQNGLCFWWGIPMECTNSDPLNYRKVSLDRLDSDKGYTPDNVVLCTEAANKCKSRMTAAEFLQLQTDISANYHNAPCHTLLSDPARFLPTPPQSEPPAEPPLDKPAT